MEGWQETECSYPAWIGAMLQALPEAAVVLDANEAVVAANRAGRTWLGADCNEQIQGQPLSQWWPERAFESSLGPLWGEDRLECRALPARWKRMDGRVRYPRVSARRSRDLCGRVFTVLQISPDPQVDALASADESSSGQPSWTTAVTGSASNEATAQLRAERDAAQRADAAKTCFVSTLSHELRTPINGVSGLCQLLLGTELSEEQRLLARQLSVSAKTLLTLVNDVLDMSKVSAGKMNIECEPFDLHETLFTTLDLFAGRDNRAQVILEECISPDLPRWVRGDATRLRQILTNFIGNALKFTSEGGVVLGAEVIGDSRGHTAPMIEFWVRDTGIGIADHRLDVVFEAFEQAESCTSRYYGGTGLGLAICRRLAVCMGGQVGVRSREGQGSTFWCRLPLQVSEDFDFGADTTESLPGDEADLNVQGARILLAEDDAVSRLVAERALRGMGCEVRAVSTGEAAVATAMDWLPDLVVMDGAMPELDGYAATKMIRDCMRAEVRAIPIVALTASALQGDRERCLKAGMDDYVSKPVNLLELRGVLHKWLACDHACSSGGL